MHDTDFLETKNKFFNILNGREDDLGRVLEEFEELLKRSGRGSIERSDCFIALSRLFKSRSHRIAVLEWIKGLVVSVGREHRIFSELITEIFVPFLTPPLSSDAADMAPTCDVLRLLANPLTAPIVVSAYCDIYSSPLAAKRQLEADVAMLNERKLFTPIDLDEAALDSEIAFWLS